MWVGATYHRALTRGAARLDWLNYHHLYYFFRIHQDGGVARAAARLRLSHSTLSVQLATLEQALGATLFERRGRRLSLTPMGSEVAAYASEIFRLGDELIDVARGHTAGRRSAFRVGVVHALPKTFTSRLLQPALDCDEGAGPVHVRQGELESLLGELATNRLHLVLSDAPPPPNLPLRLHAHALGDSAVLLFGSPELATRYRPGFPHSLTDAPMLLPSGAASLRRGLDRWFIDRGIRVRIQAEVDDAGLLRVFGGEGRGLFPVRAGLRSEVEEEHGAVLVGTLDGLRDRYYAISIERRVRHVQTAAVIESARASFANSQSAQPRKKPAPARAPRARR